MLRYTTERPETIDAGENILVGLEVDRAKEIVERILNDEKFEKAMRSAPNSFGTERQEKEQPKHSESDKRVRL